MAYSTYGSKKEAEKKAYAEALSELKRRIKEGDTEGLYIFFGEEEYLKRFYFGELKKSSGDSVNVTVLQGEVDFGELCDELSAVPMREFSLFDETEDDIVKRVIKLDSPDFSKLSDRESDEAISLLSDVGKMSVVVIYYSNIEPAKGKNTQSIIKKLSESALSVNFQRAEPGDTTLLRWIKKHFDKEKINISAEDVRYLSDSVGTDMSLLSNEIDKLCAYMKYSSGTEITKKDIDYICIKNAEAVTFDVTDAMTDRNFERAVSALSVLKSTKTEPLMIFGAISKAVGDIAIVETLSLSGKTNAEISAESGMRDFVVRKYAAFLKNAPKDYSRMASKLCLDADYKLKSGGDGYRVLENLLFRLIK